MPKKVVPEAANMIPDHANRVFEGVIFDVYQWQQELFDGTSSTFEMLRRPDTVVFIAIKDDKIIFIREQQPGRPEFVDLPAGRVDKGEDWNTAARRECAEELGLKFQNWRLVAVVQPVIKMEWFVATYLATDCIAEHATKHDAGERISPLPMSFTEAKEYVLSHPEYFVGYIGDLFDRIDSLQELLALPEFEGKPVG
jgi:ADP-ribose pyrophosphatase